jgi:hypothetical protein
MRGEACRAAHVGRLPTKMTEKASCQMTKTRNGLVPLP